MQNLCEKENSYFKENLGEEFCDKEIKFAKDDERLEFLAKLIEEKITKQNLSEEEQLQLYGYFIHKTFTKFK